MSKLENPGDVAAPSRMFGEPDARIDIDFEATMAPVVVVVDGAIVASSIAATALLGGSQRGELNGSDWSTFGSAQYLDEQESDLQLSSSAAIIRNLDGEEFPCQIRRMAMRWKGRPGSVLWLDRQPMDQPAETSEPAKRTEDEAPANRQSDEVAHLRRRFERLKAYERFLFDERTLNKRLFELTQEAIAITKNNTVTLCNPAFAQYVGIESANGVVGLPVASFLPDTTFRSRFGETEPGANPEEGDWVEHELIDVHGGKRPVETVTARFEHDGDSYGLIVCRDIAKRRENELRLTESEARYKTLFDLAPAGIMVIGERIEFANHRLAEILGIDDPSELVGKLPIDFTHEDFHDEVKRRMELDEGVDWSQPTDRVYVRKDGSHRRVELTGAYVKERGRRLFILAVRDVTEERNALAKLALNEERLRTVLWAGEVGAWEWNLETRDLFLSPEIIGWLGLAGAKDDWTSELLERIHEEEREGFIEASRAFAAGESGSFEAEIRLKTGDGKYRWFLQRGRRIELCDGTSPKLAGTLTDIHFRREQQERLQEAEERFELALQGGSQGVWDWDIENDTSTFSIEWRRMLGLEPEGRQIMGIADWKELVHPDDFDQAWSKQQAHMRGETPSYEAEFRMRHTSGDWVWILSRGKVTKRGPGGEPLRIVGTHTDISARKRDDERIAELNRQLTSRAALLEASNAELEAFAYSVSHDLRSPLRSIDGFAAALDEDFGTRLGEDGRSFVLRIRSSAKRMAQLIDDLLALSRVTRHPVQRRRVDLSSIVGNIGEELKKTAPDRSIQWTVQPNVWADADPKLIQIVLSNLLANAFKFTRGVESPSIDFSTKVVDGIVAYCVADNGVGFDQSYAHNLFRPFARLHSSESFEGHGIGLATVQRIVSRHGGRVWASANQGVGASFFFTLGAVATEL